MVFKTCPICGKVFHVPQSQKFRIYCSRDCQVKDKEWRRNISESKKYKERFTKICPICGKEFEVPPSQERTIYCSRECWRKSDQWRKHISEANKGRKSMTSDRYKRIATTRTKHKWTYEELYRLYWIEEKTLVEMAEELGAGGTSILYWMVKYGIPRRNNLYASNRKPNGLEIKLINIIEDEGLPFKYVGNGIQMIGTRKPDFISTDGKKKVIELFGRYWHDPEVNSTIHSSSMVNETVSYYENNGYKCLIIWEEELNEVNNLVKKIGEF